MHLSWTPLGTRGPVFSIVWMRESSNLIPALHAMSCVLMVPFSGTVSPAGVSISVIRMHKCQLPFMAPERTSVGGCRVWPPVSWVAVKMSWGWWMVIWQVGMEGWASRTVVSTCWSTTRWKMMVWGAVMPWWRRPPLVMVQFHFGRVRLIGVLVWWPPMIKSWLPLLSHQRCSSDNWRSSPSSGFPWTIRSLYWVVLDISSAFRVRAVMSFIWSTAMTISVRSD